MVRRKSAPSSLSFCEWVVGATIPQVLGPIPKKPPKQREVVTVEVLTDDETEEDILKIRYPRSGRSKRSQGGSRVAVKKVRFQDMHPKSAMQKEAVRATEKSDSSSDEPPQVKNPNGEKAKKQPAGSSDSEDDSEPDPTCYCKKCVRGRHKHEKKCSKKSESLDSDAEDGEIAAEGSRDKKKKKKKKKKDKDNQQDMKAKGKKEDAVEESASESESESANDTNEESDADNERKDDTKGKPIQVKKKKTKGENKQNESGAANRDKSGDKKDSEPTDEAAPETNKEADQAKDKTSKRTNMSDEKHAARYPAGLPGPHARRPNLIEPIRAEVVQTERVIATPEDPPPNAYYDSENSIVRIYHGPVYGHHGHALYPKRNPSHLPLPIGMPHPARNPYYHGFHLHPNKDNFEHVPITQGMPMSVWNAYCPPAYAGYTAPILPPGAPPPPPAAAAAIDRTKGAFSMQASSKDADIAGANNVYPSGLENSYIPKRSPFANLGSQRAAGGSPRNSAASKKGASSSLANAQQSQSGWPSASLKGQDQQAWGSGDQAQNQGPGWPTGGQKNPSALDFNGDPAWQTAADKNGGGADEQAGKADTWGESTNAQETGGGGESWGQADRKEDLPVADNNNNVMPGTWDTVPAWGDPTMAASTNGQVDNQWC